MVLAYDPLEDRRTIDIIVTKFFPPCFKMAESFENLDNILGDWANTDKYVLPRHWTGSKSKNRKDEAVSSKNYNNPEKFLEQSQSAVELE